MTTRRSFLTALGTSLVGLGLPGVAGAWGRRRRRHCQPVLCPSMPCSPLQEYPALSQEALQGRLTGPAQCLCAQSETQVGDMWYVTGEVCPPTNPVQYQSFTWSTELLVGSGCQSTCDPQYCVEYKIGTQANSRRRPAVHYVPPGAKLPRTTLNLNNAPPTVLTSWTGQAVVLAWHDCTLKYKSDPAVPVRLMLLGLGLSQNATVDQGMVIAPVGQQAASAPGGLPDESGSASNPDPTRHDYFVVTHDHFDYHVLMVP